MKVAYLITAYNNFNHLIALIKKIKVDNSLVYIHIDKKTIIPDFFTSFSQNEKNLTIIREGANKQVISSQADSLIKISRIWADFFPANTSNQPI